jgi:hypothetical protein
MQRWCYIYPQGIVSEGYQEQTTLLFSYIFKIHCETIKKYVTEIEFNLFFYYI